MTQKSLYWYTAGFAGDIGDGSAPYTQEEQRLYDHALLAGNEADGGVWSGVLNELQVTGVATPLVVDTGRASVYGFPYWNDAAANVAVTTPSVGDTGGRLTLRASWATQTVRATVVMNTDGNAGIPALVQVAGTTWDIPLATFVIDTSGDIWTDSSTSVAGVSDARVFAISPLAGMVKLREFVGDGTTGTCTFNYIQQNLSHLLIVALGRSDAVGVTDGANMIFNNDTGFVYSGSRISAINGAVASVRYAGLDGISCGSLSGAGGVADAADLLEITIPHYTSPLQKAAAIRNNCRGDGTIGANGVRSEENQGWWADTDPITRIDVFIGGNFETGTTITLYGLR